MSPIAKPDRLVICLVASGLHMRRHRTDFEGVHATVVPSSPP